MSIEDEAVWLRLRVVEEDAVDVRVVLALCVEGREVVVDLRAVFGLGEEGGVVEFGIPEGLVEGGLLE